MTVVRFSDAEVSKFKDGSIMDKTGNTLKISSTSTEDTGLYRCRASSKFAKKLSKIALLQVKKDKADTCDDVPTVLDVTLPVGCNVTLDGTNATKMNVGECLSESCVSRDDKTTGRCCVPLNTEDIEVQCETHNYTMKKILSCGCGQCEIGGDVDVTGNVNVRMVISGNSTLVPVNASLFVPGYEIDPDDSNTTGNGFFSFSATPDAGRITVRFYQDNNADFLPQTIVIDVPRDVSSVTRNVVLQAKPEAVPLNAASGGAVNMSSVDGSPSVTIPPNSIVDADGNPYNGPVKVYPTFADPRDLDSISEAPGDFSFENEEGESQDLQTNGVLGLFFEDDNGNPLQLSGKTTLTLDPDSLGIGKTKDGQPDSYVWTLDADTGKWKMSAPLTYASRRKKRDIFLTNSVVASLVIPYPLPYINLDKPALRRVRCKLIIQVYADMFFTQPLTELSLQVVSMSPNGAIYIGYTNGYTNRKGRACVTVMCGFRHIIILKPVLGQPIAHPVHHLPAGFGFTNIGQGKVMFK
ncbi:hypothetical protein LSAT2_027738 [Lamellibrachia satsuma]|nr:hypothetical protein LSAT2_027738 [Lamellibrachia satsuma]